MHEVLFLFKFYIIHHYDHNFPWSYIMHVGSYFYYDRLFFILSIYKKIITYAKKYVHGYTCHLLRFFKILHSKLTNTIQFE